MSCVYPVFVAVRSLWTKQDDLQTSASQGAFDKRVRLMHIYELTSANRAESSSHCVFKQDELMDK